MQEDGPPEEVLQPVEGAEVEDNGNGDAQADGVEMVHVETQTDPSSMELTLRDVNVSLKDREILEYIYF